MDKTTETPADTAARLDWNAAFEEVTDAAARAVVPITPAQRTAHAAAVETLTLALTAAWKLPTPAARYSTLATAHRDYARAILAIK